MSQEVLILEFGKNPFDKYIDYNKGKINWFEFYDKLSRLKYSQEKDFCASVTGRLAEIKRLDTQ